MAVLELEYEEEALGYLVLNGQQSHKHPGRRQFCIEANQMLCEIETMKEQSEQVGRVRL